MLPTFLTDTKAKVVVPANLFNSSFNVLANKNKYSSSKISRYSSLIVNALNCWLVVVAILVIAHCPIDAVQHSNTLPALTMRSSEVAS